MPIQPIRGNPEQKQVMLNMGFSGGMNITSPDDMLTPTTMRNLVNYDLESFGDISTRKGFGESKALTDLLYPIGVYHNLNIDLTTQKEVFFSLLQNDNSAWQRLADCDSYADYLTLFGTTNTIRYLRLVVVTADGSLRWEDVTVLMGTAPTFTIREGVIDKAVFNSTDVLLNWNHVDKYGRFYFTNNDKGLFIFDAEATDPTDPWTIVGEITQTVEGVTTSLNEAYRPNAIEARKLGFNVLGDTPLGWLYESELTTETIQGVYLTTSDRRPIKVVPPTEGFQINILYTGDQYDFTIAMNEYAAPIGFTAVKNTTHSVNGSLAVYDITMNTKPTDEIEFVINFTSETVTLEDYIDYYPTGMIPADAVVVENLNVGEFKIMEMYDRLVYYHGNVIWFSEVNVYDYIPNYNYLIVPLDKTDEIVRILFFRSNYIVFTKRRIYRLSGDFETTSFRLDLVNDNIGCIAPNSAMVIDNQMFFLSTQGLRALKTDTFKENFENVLEFDAAVRPLIYSRENVYAIAYKDQYILMSNLQGVAKETSVNLRYYRVPDQIRFYYKHGSFVTDIYADGIYPKFIFSENGELYSLNANGVYSMGKSNNDFGISYDAILETTSMNLGYPVHEKKIKAVIVKAGGGNYTQPITIQVASDGEVVVSSELMPVGLDQYGNVVYGDSHGELDIKDATPMENMFGDGTTRYHTKKFRATARGKNIAIRILVRFDDKFSLQGLGYIYKLGKVRE